MPNLFIIGNGFDKDLHCLKTDYSDFHDYLIRTVPESTSELCVPEVNYDKDGNRSVYRDSSVSFMRYLLDCTENIDGVTARWSNVEKSLGILDWEYCFDGVNVANDKDGDEDHWAMVGVYEDVTDGFCMAANIFNELFTEWVLSINISKVVPDAKFAALIDPINDYFLNFNYTHVLEDVYDVKNVCHIHGSLGEQILFGHGIDDVDALSDRIMSRYAGAEDNVVEAHEAMRKPTSLAIENHCCFFDQLAAYPPERIYTLGWGYSEVDQVYLLEIFKRLDTVHITWHLWNEEAKYHKKTKQLLISLGFKGSFDTFD